MKLIDSLFFIAVAIFTALVVAGIGWAVFAALDAAHRWLGAI